MVEAIILLIILALIAFAKGDSSGVEAILKFVVYGVLIIAVLYVVAYFPWLAILIVIGIIALSVYLSNRSSSNNNLSSNETIDHKPSDVVINNPDLTGFKEELQNNTKTPAQVIDEAWQAEIKEIEKIVQQDYRYIKQELKSKAQSGDYVVHNNQRHMTIRNHCSYLSQCIGRSWSSNPTGRFGTSSYRPNEKVEYAISKVKQFDLYVNKIKELAKEDDISIVVSFYELSDAKEYAVSLPYTYRGMFTRLHKVNAYLVCSISY